MMGIDEMLGEIPAQPNIDEEEVLLGLVQGIGTHGWYMDAISIGELIAEALFAAKGAGMDYIALRENEGLQGDPLHDAWCLVRLLASGHSFRAKLVVFIGTLVAIGDSQGLDWRDKAMDAINKIKQGKYGHVDNRVPA